MRASRVSPSTAKVGWRAAVSGCAAAALVLTAAASAGAQSPTTPPAAVSKPMSLAPPQRLESPAETPDQTPPSSDGKATEGAPAQGSQESPYGSIQVNPLKAVGADSAGTLSRAQGGFGTDMWQGTSRSLIKQLLPNLSVRTTSPVERDLMRRLLLSSAVAPSGDGGSDNFLVQRLAALEKMGEPQAVFDLVRAVPGRGGDDRLARYDADAQFQLNDLRGACAVVGGHLDSSEAYWHKAFAFCQMLAGDTDKASLSVSLLKETGGGDPSYFSLANILLGNDTRVLKAFSDPTPLTLAMAREAKVTLPDALLTTDRPLVLRAIAVNPHQTPAFRLAAGERAQALGVLPDSVMRDIYKSVPFTDDQLNNPLTAADKLDDANARALLYQAATDIDVAVAQAEGTALALEKARADGRYAATARTFLPVIQHIQPSPDLSWFAAEAIRALLVNNAQKVAGSWYQILQARSRFDQDAETAMTQTAPIAALAGLPQAAEWQTADLAGWWKQENAKPGAHHRATVLFTLFEGLGEKVPVAVWDKLLGGGRTAVSTMPDAAVLRRLADAAAGRRVGETVLLAALALGDAGPAESDPMALRQIVGGLYKVGLVPEARSVALEAALAVGL